MRRCFVFCFFFSLFFFGFGCRSCFFCVLFFLFWWGGGGGPTVSRAFLIFINLRDNIKCHCTSAWGIEFMGGQPKPPECFSQQKHGSLSRNLNFFGFENPMINLYEKTEKVTLINPFRPPPPQKKSCPILPYNDT